MIAGLPTSMRRTAMVFVAVAVVALAAALWWAVSSGSTDANAGGDLSPTARAAQSQPAAATLVKSQPAASTLVKSQRRPTKLYWGAWIGDQLTGEEPPYDMSAVSKFAQIVGKQLSLVEFSVPFADCATSPCTFYDFPTTPMQDIRSYGAIPVLSWSSASTPGGVRQPDYQLSDLIAGRYDSYIRDFATAAKSWGHPFFLRFNWEMNGGWFPWGIRVNGNRPSQYVPAWRHVRRIFDAVGADNASWVWCPYVDIENKYNLKALYPGNAYVDWTCLDGYNWGPRSPANPRPARSFGGIFRSTYRRVVTKIAPRKPMILAELATSDYGVNKAAWLRNMLTTLPRNYPKVRGFVYFDFNDRNARWEIETSAAATRAFRRGIRQAAYVTNRYGGINSRPIRPPSQR